MTKTKLNKLERKDEYYVNIDKNIYENLTRHQVAFICLINKLNKANLTASNKEMGAYLGITPKYVKRMIDKINAWIAGLIKVNYKAIINHLGQIKANDMNGMYSRGRSISLARELHTKGNDYINLPDFSVTKRSQFLSGNELKVFSYIKAMPEKSFKGFLRVMSNKLALSLGIIRRALKKLLKVKAIFKKYLPIKHKIKNIYYSVNLIKLNTEWKYIKVNADEATYLKKRIQSNYSDEDDEWNKIIKNLGVEL